MELVDVYALTRTRMLELANGLDDEVARTAVPALPGWTVKDAYAHLTGVCVDVLAGAMEGAGTPAWTAKQVGDRAAHGLPAVCDEWSGRSQEIEGWLRSAGGSGSFLCFDVWSHEQDVRGAAGLTGERDDERVALLAGKAVDVFDGRLKAAGAPPVRVVTGSIDRILGGAAADVALRSTDYELLRVLFGRRSRAQLGRADWDGDPEPCIEHLHLFDLPLSDLVD